MLWLSPDPVRMLWSSRNGLFSTSPVTYLAALGLVVFAVRDRRFGRLALAVFALAVYVNASVEDWWGGAAFGARRFDGTMPLLAVGLAAAVDALRRWNAKRPLAGVAAVLGLLVLWNIAAIAAGVAGRFGGSVPQSFADLAVDQARTLSRWFGHPFSYPANLVYAAREGVAPFRYDYFAFPMLGDPERPYGRVDIGLHDEAYLGDGWYQADTQPDGTTARWSRGTAEVLVPLDHPAPLIVQLRLKPFSYPGASLNLAVRVNGRSFGPFPLGADWQRVDFPDRRLGVEGGGEPRAAGLDGSRRPGGGGHGRTMRANWAARPTTCDPGGALRRRGRGPTESRRCRPGRCRRSWPAAPSAWPSRSCGSCSCRRPWSRLPPRAWPSRK